MARQLSEVKTLTATESKLRERAEEEVNQLQSVTERLQQQIQNSAIITGYFNPRLDLILRIAEELRKGMPQGGPETSIEARE